ncbi:syntaxin 8 [Stylonychia lemnae]|uniref:Syntaxin 8 n=1 Tax=Stylonychia lemnae TaxID=5949 RepID=A0A078BB50_STYLE|nr:syntaxin 8 [Stylonychia lemnae]|eukprot:CDW91411.1 syntaxin 8 [Stylonychia lemnae]
MASKKFDRFYDDLNKLEQLEDRLSNNLNQKNLAIKAGEPTGKYEYLIQSSVDSLRDDLSKIQRLAFVYQNEPHQHPDLTQKERQKRVQKIEELEQRIPQLLAQAKQSSNADNISGKQRGYNQYDDEERNYNRDEEGEFEDTKAMDERQLITKNKKIMNDQDRQLDEIQGIVSSIKYENQNMQDELGHQNVILSKIDGDIERNFQRMVKVDNKLKKLIASSNHWCIWIIIIIEIVILILVNI